MLDDIKIDKNEKINEIIFGAQFLTFLLTVAVLIVSLPESYSYMGFFAMLFGFFVPAGVIVALDYCLFFLRKDKHYKTILWWNIFKLSVLFLLITFTITFLPENLPIFVSMYLLPIVVAVITLGRAGGMILAGISSVVFLLVSSLLAGEQGISLGTIFLFSAIFLLVAWLLGGVMGIEENTKKELRDQLFERKKMENVLRDNEESLRQIIELMPAAVLVHINGKIIYANDAAVKIVNFPSSQLLIGKDITQVLGEHFRGLINLKKYKKENSKIRQSDGTSIDVELTSIPLYYKDKEAVQTLLSNITERKRMEEELYKANKLESLAILAGGVAHDFNNLLAVILGNVSLIKTYQDQNKIAGKVKSIENVVTQAKELTQQLLIFSKGEEPIKRTTCLKNLLKDVVRFSLSGSNVNFECIFPDDDYQVEIDKSQINQVFNNLLINAVQSMPEGGTVQIKAEKVMIGDQEKRHLPLKEGNYIKISVKDKGVGMSEQFLKNIFDPFFTTKVEGTGLGLAITYTIIQKHDGFLQVDSEIGVGTTFNIYLPATAPKMRLVHRGEELIRGGEGRILLVDDQDTIRQVVKEMLVSLGYEADIVSNGADAIKFYTRSLEQGEKYAAVVIDLTIPAGMGAVDTIKELLKIDAGVKAILSSGYTMDPVILNFREYGFKGFLGKPYRIEELDRVLHEVIG